MYEPGRAMGRWRGGGYLERSTDRNSLPTGRPAYLRSKHLPTYRPNFTGTDLPTDRPIPHHRRTYLPTDLWNHFTTDFPAYLPTYRTCLPIYPQYTEPHYLPTYLVRNLTSDSPTYPTYLQICRPTYRSYLDTKIAYVPTYLPGTNLPTYEVPTEPRYRPPVSDCSQSGA